MRLFPPPSWRIDMSLLSSIGRTAFRLGFELSPILLTRGIASNIPGGTLPLIALTQSIGLIKGLLSGGNVLDTDTYFAHFTPVTGATLVNNQIGKYPFANQAVAGNAIIAQPLNVALMMTCPVNDGTSYLTKLMTMKMMKATLDKHNQAGGTYTVLTPSNIYTDCVLTSLKDVTGGSTKQAQAQWQWDFEQPLIAQSDAVQALNNMMSKLKQGLALPTGGLSWSGPSATSNVTGGV